LISQGVPPLGVVKQEWGGENKLFSRKQAVFEINAAISQTVGDMSKVTIDH